MTIFLAGLITGSIYAIVAIGYNITLIMSGALNFAFPAVVILGSFIGYWGITEHHYQLYVVFLVSAAVCTAVAAAEERIAIRPIAKPGSHAVLVTTVGAATILTGVMTVVWGSNPQQIQLPGSTGSIHLFGGIISPIDIAIVAIALAAGALLHLWTTRTRLGIAGMAQSQDREAAIVKGVNVRAMSLGAFAVSGLLAGALGPIVGAEIGVSANNALSLAVKGFIALAIGGAASQAGALIGGLFIGIVEAVTEYYVGGNAGDLVIFGVFMIVVLLMPQGLLGKRRGRTV
jgi:branched-chain amino acid transport system permease protein